MCPDVPSQCAPSVSPAPDAVVLAQTIDILRPFIQAVDAAFLIILAILIAYAAYKAITSD